MGARGPGRSKGDGGHRPKITEERHEEIYSLFTDGMPVAKIVKQLELHVTPAVVYKIIKQIRLEKKEHLKEVMNADTDDILGKYKWLQEQLEQMFVENKKDLKVSLLVVKELRAMYEYQITITHKLNQEPISSDYGKEQFQEEMKKLTEALHKVEKL